MIWTWPIHFGCDHFILVETKSLWSSPNQFGQTKTILDRPKLFWSHRRTRHKCSLIKISTHCQRVLSVSFPLMQSSSYVWSRESAELRAESRSGSNAGQSSKARSNKKFFQLYFSEPKVSFQHISNCNINQPTYSRLQNRRAVPNMFTGGDFYKSG